MADKTTRQAEFDRIVDRVSDRWRGGHPPDPSAIMAAYPHLMPELGEWLDSVRAIQSATGLPESSPLDDESDGGLELLREKLDGYTVVGRLKHGGQGTVYMAQQHGTERMVAIKLLLPNPDQRLKSRFAREVELLTRLDHPNVVTVYESGEVYDRPYIVMEYVAGLPLDDYVYVASPSLRDTVGLFRLICLAVGAAHDVGIIHRDLKPSNILVTPDGQPHVLDFGLAADVTATDAPVTISLTGHVVGTLPYMSPEQVAGQREMMDVRTDIYSLGVVLYELISGGYPYPIDADRAATAKHIATATPERLRDAVSVGYSKPASSCARVGEDIERIVLKALSKEPARRYHSAAEFADDLDRFLCGEAVAARADSSIYVLKKALRRYRTQTLVASAFVLLLVAGLVEVTRAWRNSAHDAATLAAALNMVGHTRMAGGDRDRSHIEEAIDAYRQAIAIGKRLQSKHLVVRRFYFEACYNLADTLIKAHRADEAFAPAQRAAEIATTTVAEHPDDLEWQRQLGFAHYLSGLVTMIQDDPAAAHTHFSKCVAVRQKVADAMPDDVNLREELASAVSRVAWCSRAMDRFAEAYDGYMDAWRLRVDCVERRPNVAHFESQLAVGETQMANWHLDTGTPRNLELVLAWLDLAERRIDSLPETWERNNTLRDIRNNRRIALDRLSRYAGTPTSDGSTGSSSPSATGSSSPSSRKE